MEFSTAQTMPLLVPDAEIAGVEPGYEKLPAFSQRPTAPCDDVGPFWHLDDPPSGPACLSEGRVGPFSVPCVGLLPVFLVVLDVGLILLHVPRIPPHIGRILPDVTPVALRVLCSNCRNRETKHSEERPYGLAMQTRPPFTLHKAQRKPEEQLFHIGLATAGLVTSPR